MSVLREKKKVHTIAKRQSSFDDGTWKYEAGLVRVRQGYLQRPDNRATFPYFSQK